MIKPLPLLGYWAACCWPLCNFVSSNYAELRAHGLLTSVWPSFLIVLTLIVLGTVISLLAGRYTRVSAAATVTAMTLLLIAFFLYPQFKELHIDTHAIFVIKVLNANWVDGSGEPYIPFTYGLFMALLLAVSVWFGRYEVFRAVVAIFALANVVTGLVFLGNAIAAAVALDAQDRSAPLVSRVAGNTKLSGENVYFFVLDAYASRASLKQIFDHDNLPFIENMKEKGFIEIPDARSNYLSTTFSISSIFDLDFTRKPGDKFEGWEKYYPHFIGSDVPPRLVQMLQTHGYSIWFAPLEWTQCPVQTVLCIEGNRKKFLTYPTMTFLKTTPVHGVLNALFDDMVMALDQLPEKLEEVTSKSPFFLFMHNLAPHPPFLFEDDCSQRPGEMFDLDSWADKMRPSYVDNVICVNTRLEALISEILLQDPSAIIVLQADHGSGFLIEKFWGRPMKEWTNDAIEERRSILNMIRVPEVCADWIRADMGQVNTIRLVIGCLQRKPPEYVEERTILNTYADGPEFGKFIEYDPRQ